MARFSTNLGEIEGSEAYILEVSLEDENPHPIHDLTLEKIGEEMGENQLYIQTTDRAGTSELISRIDEKVDLNRTPLLLLLDRDPLEATSAGVVYLDDIESKEETVALIRELVQRLYSSEFMDEYSTWNERMTQISPYLIATVGIGADALTYIANIS